MSMLSEKTTVDEGVEGNSRLTSANGMVLLVMLAVEGVTILDVRSMLTLHIFLGIMIVPPVLLKSATALYRFAKYYRGAEPYVRKGPPHIVLRALGPLVVLTSLALLGTGVGLLAVHPTRTHAAHPAPGQLHRVGRRHDHPRTRPHHRGGQVQLGRHPIGPCAAGAPAAPNRGRRCAVHRRRAGRSADAVCPLLDKRALPPRLPRRGSLDRRGDMMHVVGRWR